MHTLILTLHIVVALAMIGLILLQQGKGAEAGASFGGGASATVFGASGSANALSRTTAVLTTIFFITSLSLAVMAKRQAAELLRLPGAPASTATQVIPPVNTAPAPVTAPITVTPSDSVAAEASAPTVNVTPAQTNAPSQAPNNPVQ